MSPHKPHTERDPVAIVSDVALDNALSIGLLRATLAGLDRARTPLICLLREDTRQALTQADALGAFDIVKPETPRSGLVDAVLRALMATHDGEIGGLNEAALNGVMNAGFILAEIMDAAEDGGAVTPQSVSEGADLVLRTITDSGVAAWLDVVWGYDDVTYQHILLVAGLAASFARKLGFSRKDAKLVTEAALVHDIGKAGIPLDILNKPGRLTDDEMAVMRTHAAIGYDILKAQGGFSPRVMAVVRSHHEQLDGGGYPDGLAADAIPDMVRLVTICDIYAALIERRPYREPLPPAEAFRIMREMGPRLDHDILAAFVKAMA